MSVRRFLNFSYAVLTEGLTEEGVSKIDGILTGEIEVPTVAEPQSVNTKALMAVMGMPRKG